MNRKILLLLFFSFCFFFSSCSNENEENFEKKCIKSNGSYNNGNCFWGSELNNKNTQKKICEDHKKRFNECYMPKVLEGQFIAQVCTIACEN